jgi:hypothetical protein
MDVKSAFLNGVI